MENLEQDQLCFPQLLNTSCKKPVRSQTGDVLFYFLSFISLLTASLNLLVIISISHFRQRYAPQKFYDVVIVTQKEEAALRWMIDVFMSCLHIETCALLTVIIALIKLFVFIFIVMILSHSRQLHTTTNLVLLSLAVSDFLVGLVAMPGDIILMETCWLLGDLMCALYFLLPFIITSASVGSIVLISVDRCVAICFPLHYPTKVTKKRIQISVCICWIYSLFYSICFLYDELKQPGRYRSNSCYGECVVNVSGDLDLVFGFIIPISMITTLYLRVFVVAVSQARAMRSHIAAVTLQRSGTVTAKRSELKAARTLGIVVAVFLMCYCPYYCVSLTGGKLLIGSTIETFLVFLLYFNSCLNPVIYAFFYPWFRKAMRLIVTLQVMQPGSCEAKIL